MSQKQPKKIPKNSKLNIFKKMFSNNKTTPESTKMSLFKPNQLIWVAFSDKSKPHEPFKLAKVLEIYDTCNKIKVKFDNDNQVEIIPLSIAYMANDYTKMPNGYDDMVHMDNLSEAELLHNIRIRFEKNNQIYTYVGSTLLIINPYTEISSLLSKDIENLYKNAIAAPKYNLKDNPPHIFAVAGYAMKSLLETKKNQAMVISGESGAGKTESTKQAMKFLAGINRSNNGSQPNSPKVIDDSIEARILACNPILEAFGNAKTVKNDNSSRFGKYVTLMIHKESKQIKGAKMTNYLLEKSRLIAPGKNERNYHIFYMMFKFMNEDKLDKLFLMKNGKADMTNYNYLSQANNYQAGKYQDQQEYQKLIQAFETINFQIDEIDAIWKILASCMHLGQVEFDESTLTDSAPCKVINNDYMEFACKLLDINYQETVQALRIKTRIIPGSDPIPSPLPKDECNNSKDSMAKALYNNLFNWLVKRLNYTILPNEIKGLNTKQLSLAMKDYYGIGLLDIFGFENMELNSLEQFCINFANERLQQLYVKYVFEAEKQEFIDEGLIDHIGLLSYQNNKPLIEMIDSAQGIFQLIDESSTINSTDEKLLANILKIHKGNPKITPTPRKKDSFTIVHSAKDVDYTITGFRMKNKDELSPYINKAMCNSSNKVIMNIWRNIYNDDNENEDDNALNENAKVNTKPSSKFLGAKFRTQMKDLMIILENCQCHFIRCIKPNDERAVKVFHPALILKQIKYMGILDTVVMRRDSYPHRKSYQDFFDAYGEIDSTTKTIFEKQVDKKCDLKSLTSKMLEKLTPQLNNKTILFGHKKIFMRSEALSEIENLLEKSYESKKKYVQKFKNAYFRMSQLKKFRRMLKGIKKIQRLWRVRKEYCHFQAIRKATRRIQYWWLRIYFKRKLAKIKFYVRKIQSFLQMANMRIKYFRILNSAQIINRLWRGALARKYTRKIKTINYSINVIINKSVDVLMYKVRKFAAITIQRHARGYITRSKYSDIVTRCRKAKIELFLNKNAMIIQKHIRGFIVRSSMVRLNKAASYIQGYFRMVWLSSLFQKLRKAVRIIQRSFRMWYIRKQIIRERLAKYLQNEIMEDTYGNKEMASSYLKNHNVSSSIYKHPFGANTINTTTMSTHMLDQSQLYTDNNAFLPSITQSLAKEISPYTSRKINLAIRLVDIDTLTNLSCIYDPPWIHQCFQLQKECMQSDSDLQIISVGDYHTLAISNTNKVYSWGWNDNYQLGKPQLAKIFSFKYSSITLPPEFTRPKCVATGDNHNLILDVWGNLLLWGSNSKCELGLGHCRDVPRMINLDFVEKNDKIIDIRACSINSLAITENGKAYYWPFETTSANQYGKPIELRFPNKIQIASASCGYNFAILVTKSGLIYSFGKDNKEGQLGLGDRIPRETPTLIEILKKEGDRITTVQCGFKHVIAKTSLGRVYTWGWGIKGQLGHGSTENELQPRLVNLSYMQSKMKVLHVAAGYKHSIILLENKKILWWGTNGTIKEKTLPCEMNLSAKLPEMNNEFTPIRILCSWSKTMSITYITFADTRSSDLPILSKQKVLSTLITKIEEFSAFNDIDPPYIDSIAKYFPSKVMKPMSKKPNILGSPGRKNKSLNMVSNNITDSNISLFEKKPSLPNGATNIYDIGKINKNPDDIFISHQPNDIYNDQNDYNNHLLSPKFKETQPIDNNEYEEDNQIIDSDTSSTCRQLENLDEKLKDIKKKMIEISKIPKEKWTANDIEFMKIATEPKVLALLKQSKVQFSEMLKIFDCQGKYP